MDTHGAALTAACSGVQFKNIKHTQKAVPQKDNQTNSAGLAADIQENHKKKRT
jgi:hypothetical protein